MGGSAKLGAEVEDDLAHSGERPIMSERPSGVVCKRTSTDGDERALLDAPEISPRMTRWLADPALLTTLAMQVAVGDLMDGVAYARPDVPLAMIADRLAKEDVVVVDRFGVPLGVVKAGWQERLSHPPRACAGEAMEPIGTIRESDRLAKALGLMAIEQAPSMCVVSRDQTLVGMLHARRALAWLALKASEPGSSLPPPPRDSLPDD